MKPVIYYRKSLMDNDELKSAKKYFNCFDLLTDLKQNQLIIGRYSLLPFYHHQEKEIKNIKSNLINSYNEHLYISDLKNYIFDLKELTPKTWDSLNNLPDNTSFILKGETNSKKSLWKTHMFAKSKQEAINIYSRLLDDGVIGEQKIYIREYIPLFKYLDGINGMPVTKEFRFFVAYGKIICGDFYWQNYIDDIGFKPDVNEVPLNFLNQVINKIDNKSKFYVIDVAQTEKGNWIVIELNDGQQSGLSCINSDLFYKNLNDVVNSFNI